MEKDTFYFTHDYHARNDEKILRIRAKYGSRGYGVFWMLVEIMAEGTLPHIQIRDISTIAFSINEDAKWLEEFVNFCIDEAKLFLCDGQEFTSMRMVNHKIIRDKYHTKGKEGAIKRWGITSPNSPPNAKERKGKDRKGKERKGKKRKGKEKEDLFLFKEIYLKYPKGIGQKEAERHFKASVKTEQDWQDIQTALKNYLASGRVTKGFIQNASTWFNNWRDWITYKEDNLTKEEEAKKAFGLK